MNRKTQAFGAGAIIMFVATAMLIRFYPDVRRYIKMTTM